MISCSHRGTSAERTRGGTGSSQGYDIDTLIHGKSIDEVNIVVLIVAVRIVGRYADGISHTGRYTGRSEILIVIVIPELDTVLPPFDRAVREIEPQ